ncbi:alpha/beta hydrolase-fold protein [uncultured Pseudoteredinibacter sp.]|uniref:alpha/beta hydrolase n=1 Tax=uncultured Pseudoteredinibacter sp. TaxID=1641701 RepID=UPI002635ABB0|nr:alpha/beta hydrolase-fold protein [uncultured Pseudoteredinibacter sp.]
MLLTTRRSYTGFLLTLLMLCSISASATNKPSPSGFEIPDSEVLQIQSKQLGRSYDIYIKLPPSYFDKGNQLRKYPVVYLNDGLYSFQLASGITHAAMINRAMEHHILVGISYSPSDRPFESRRRDFTPKTEDNPNGEAEQYLGFLKQELFPLVENRYRINSLRRAYAGYSLGGIFGLYALFEHSDSFRYYLISSPSIWFSNRWVLKKELAVAKETMDINAELFMGVGAFERPAGSNDDYNKPTPINMVKDFGLLYDQLEQRNYPSLRLNKQIVEQAHHELTYPTVLTQGLYWLLPGEKYQK